MKPWISSADAPGYTVVTLTTVLDSFGYCRIGSTIAARTPIRRISRLTTTDSTGRLMKISVKAIAALSSILMLETSMTSQGHALTMLLVTRRLRRNRRQRVGRTRDRGARLQLELADRDHAITWFQAFEDFGATIDPVAG